MVLVVIIPIFLKIGFDALKTEQLVHMPREEIS